MTERPILFSAEMVRAILAGRKTQTRRAIKPQPWVDNMGNACWKDRNFGQSANHVPHIKALASPIPCSDTKRVLCPYGAPGDLLWVRETFRYFPGTGSHLWDGDREYQADGAVKSGRFFTAEEWQSRGMKAKPEPRWRPSIHMPRWASRITLEVKSVRVERLQDIRCTDAEAEGAGHEAGPTGGQARGAFANLWNHINGPGAWEANPWVWVISFQRVKP